MTEGRRNDGAAQATGPMRSALGAASYFASLTAKSAGSWPVSLTTKLMLRT